MVVSLKENKPEEWNPMQGKKVKFIENELEPENADGVCGHLEAIGESEVNGSFYDRFIKRFIDIILSLCGLVILSPIYLILMLAIVIDDPGPVFFAQKRVGKNKQYFRLHNVFKIEGEVSFCNKVLNNTRLAA